MNTHSQAQTTVSCWGDVGGNRGDKGGGAEHGVMGGGLTVGGGCRHGARLTRYRSVHWKLVTSLTSCPIYLTFFKSSV